MHEIKVNLKDGEVVLRKPTAGVRNSAMMKAEGPDGIKQIVMMVELLPLCVKAHPFGMTPVKTALNNLDCDEYDLLIDKLRELMRANEELKKKLNPESDQKEQVSIGKSE